MAELHSPEKNNLQQLITEHIDLWTGAVKAKSSAGRGGSSKRELYGIKKLRELILELAVRGKLVAQDPNDEPASVLLERIAAEKAELVKQGKIKKPKTQPKISEEEKPFELPEGWEWCRLNDLGEWGAGSTPLRSNSAYYGGDIPWFKSGELSSDFISHSEETITAQALKETSVRLNSPGDVLVAMYGATIGKASILNVEATTNQAVCACTPFTGLSNLYLLLLLKAYKGRLISMGAGGAQPNISREKLIKVPIALPSNQEQHRIVAKVDELMALCDQLEQQTESSLDAHQTLAQTLLDTLLQSAGAEELEQNWQRLSAYFDLLFTTEQSIDQLKQTILQLAVMGKLVPQDLNDEPASELLKRIAAEKEELVKQKKIKKQKPLPPISDDEKPFQLPKGWEWCITGDAGDIKLGRQRSPKDHVGPDMVPYLRVANVLDNRIDTTDVKHMNFSPEEQKTFRLEYGDILLNEGQSKELVGRSAMFKDEVLGACFQNTLLRFKPNKGVTSEFSLLYFRNCLYSGRFQKAVKQTTNIAHLSASRLIPIEFPLPPTAEQHRIVAKVDQLMALCDQLKAKLADSKTTQLNLTDALVAQAV